MTQNAYLANIGPNDYRNEEKDSLKRVTAHGKANSVEIYRQSVKRKNNFHLDCDPINNKHFRDRKEKYGTRVRTISAETEA